MTKKTILQRMYNISQKMRDPASDYDNERLLINEQTLRAANTELSALRTRLQMNTMQVLILTAVICTSSRYHIDSNCIAQYLGMNYLKFLSYYDDILVLRKMGYLYIDDDGDIVAPQKMLKAIMNDSPLTPEPTKGLDSAAILYRIRDMLEELSDNHMDSSDVLTYSGQLFTDNPTCSVSSTYNKMVRDIGEPLERLLFIILLIKYHYEDDDMISWSDVDEYYRTYELDRLRGKCNTEALTLQERKIIEFYGKEGVMTKDYIHIVEDVKDSALKDLGGVRKKSARESVSASGKIRCGDIVKKDLFYNPSDEKQIMELSALLTEERYSTVRRKMKEKGLRNAFTCIFYGAPGTGKTETVYQIARLTGRDIFQVDVSLIKSCWVGESEKMIKEVFDKYRQVVGEDGRKPILLFNEADAILGIRPEGASRAVDKMENSIQNIILQEMENLDGILIATTNLTQNLDKAFERRFLYKVRFTRPTQETKALIWMSMIPELSSEEALSLAGKFDFSGGQIENVTRKRTARAILSGSDPTFEDILDFCREENLYSCEAPAPRIGFPTGT